MNVSVFNSVFKPQRIISGRHIHVPAGNYPFTEVIRHIQHGGFERHLKAVKAKGNYAEAKKDLPCFTPSGTFQYRKDDQCTEYSSMICLDYDKVESVFRLKEKVAESPYTFAAFYSPSMAGLKVFVLTSLAGRPGGVGHHDHIRSFNQVREYFDAFTGVASDPKVKNLSRLCFVSHDPDLIFRPEAQSFPVRLDSPSQPPQHGGVGDVQDWLFRFTTGGKFQGDIVTWTDGQRNNFLFLYACNANRYGIDQATALDYAGGIAATYGMDKMTEAEIRRTVASAYRHTHEHGKFQLPKKLNQ